LISSSGHPNEKFRPNRYGTVEESSLSVTHDRR
jgi:hypothetical protein